MKFDLPGGRMQPRIWRFILATLVAVVGSLAACALLVVIATAALPATIGYPHFAFADYGKFTIVGVVCACLAWPVMTLLSSQAGRPFLLLTVIVTVVSFAPDAWIIYKGQAPEAVLVLVAMHVVVALVTYPSLVCIAPQQPTSRSRRFPVTAIR